MRSIGLSSTSRTRTPASHAGAGGGSGSDSTGVPKHTVKEKVLPEPTTLSA